MKVTRTRRREKHQPKLLIVADPEGSAQGLAQIVSTDPSFEFCGAGAPSIAILKMRQIKPNVVLLDLAQQDPASLKIIRAIKAVHSNTKILVISMKNDAALANRVLNLGSDGFFVKDENPEEMVFAIHDVLAGHIYVSESVLADQKHKRSRRIRMLQPRRNRTTGS